MNEGERELTIRRILVALDASPHSLAALEAAADMAAMMQAELLGIFVEDINLLRLAELPFTGEIGLYSTQYRALERERLERQLRSKADQVRRSLARIAERQRLNWSFQVTRGAIAAELLAAAAQVDLVILGRTGWSPLRRHLGSTARAVLSQAGPSAMILQQGARLNQPVGLVYDGSAPAQKALVTAARLALERHSPLLVFTCAEDRAEAGRLAEQISSWLKMRDLTARFRWLPASDPSGLAHLLQVEPSGLLVLSAASPTLDDEKLLDWLDQVHTPILLVR